MKTGEAVRVLPYGGTRAFEGYVGVLVGAEEPELFLKDRARIRLFLPGDVTMTLPRRHLDRGRRLWAPTEEQVLAYREAYLRAAREGKGGEEGQRLLTLDGARAGVWPILVLAGDHHEAQAWARSKRLPNEGWRRVGGPSCLKGWGAPTVAFVGSWRDLPGLWKIEEAAEQEHARVWWEELVP